MKSFAALNVGNEITHITSATAFQFRPILWLLTILCHLLKKMAFHSTWSLPDLWHVYNNVSMLKYVEVRVTSVKKELQAFQWQIHLIRLALQRHTSLAGEEGHSLAVFRILSGWCLEVLNYHKMLIQAYSNSYVSQNMLNTRILLAACLSVVTKWKLYQYANVGIYFTIHYD